MKSSRLILSMLALLLASTVLASGALTNTLGVGELTAPGTVTLSGENIESVWTDEVGIRVNADGTIDSKKGATYAQIDAGTDWIIPNGDASSLHEVRVTSVTDTGGCVCGWESAAAADDTWISLGSNRQWSVKGAGSGGADSAGMLFTLEIRWNGGAALASTVYTVDSAFD